jgi:putative flavoprotein involved in K+ transport
MVIVIGGGPAGLAAAAALHMAGVPARIYDRATEVGASWMVHYDRLHLHTVRWLSALPGLAIPREYGPWVARDHVVAYLRQFAAHHQLDVQLGVEVRRVDRAADGWTIDASAGPLGASEVVVATGYNRIPYLPEWPGRFTGELLHASRYKNGAPWAGKHALVVGGGNTGAEIAVDLVEHGAARVQLALRTPPNIVPRASGGVPTQALGVLLRRLPAPLVDRVAGAVNRLTLGDLTPYVGKPPRGAFTRARDEGQIAILDVGLVPLLKSGRIEVVGAVDGFDGAEVILAGGARTRPDVVVAATGYRRGLEPLVGHLGVLDQRGLPTVHGPRTHAEAPGLRFIGYTNPVSGNLREIAIDAKKIARAIQRTIKRGVKRGAAAASA